MYKSYFKTALRTLLRNKNYTIINIAGLGVAIAICLLIFVFVRFEESYDQFHSKKNRIYRVMTEYHHADAANIFYGSGVPFALPAAVKNAFPEIELAVPIAADFNSQLLVLDNSGRTVKKFKEEKGVFATPPTFFKVFDFPFLAGDPQTALSGLNSVVLTQEIAEKYFGDWHAAMGKTIKWDGLYTLTVTGVLAPIPVNTDLPLKIMVSYGTGFTGKYLTSTEWSGTPGRFGCYVLLRPGATLRGFDSKLRVFAKKMLPPGDKDSYVAEALTAEHFDTQVGNFGGKTISPQLINGLWLVGAFILLIACVNFINLSTAQAVNRAKEVGVRKVLGGNKSQLKLQFLAETSLIVMLAVFLAISIALLTLAPLGTIVDLPLSATLFARIPVLVFLVVSSISVTVIAGFYPSLVLSRFNPINALKSRVTMKNPRGFTLRRGLVVFQFIIAQALIVATLIFVKQMNYFTDQPLGFNTNAIVNVPFPSDSLGLSKLDFLKKELLSVRGVQNVSFSSNTPVEDDNDSWTTLRFNHATKESDFYAILKWTDDQYIPTYQLPLVAGRNFYPSDTAHEFVVDQLLLENLGIKDPRDAINKEITLWGGFIHGPIVGVMKKYNSRSFRRDLAPVLMTTLKGGYNKAGIKLSSADAAWAMGAIQKIWEQTYLDFVFEYKFLDAKIDSFYRQERQLSELFQLFAVIAIFLSCLGLYGLASFMAVQRIREVGIRKVLGASVGSIVYLFSREFVLLILIAFLIASPIAWYFMHRWLQDYVYRIDITGWVFLAGGLASVAIALMTVSFQAMRAALTNPVKSLRTE